MIQLVINESIGDNGTHPVHTRGFKGTVPSSFRPPSNFRFAIRVPNWMARFWSALRTLFFDNGKGISTSPEKCPTNTVWYMHKGILALVSTWGWRRLCAWWADITGKWHVQMEVGRDQGLQQTSVLFIPFWSFGHCWSPETPCTGKK